MGCRCARGVQGGVYRVWACTGGMHRVWGSKEGLQTGKVYLFGVQGCARLWGGEACKRLLG